tara:strand:- start:9853 stop:10818 length:966 start_codon:yes stop_codon:yes gene_type:complete
MKPYTFSGHDTFVLRHGWLKKIYDRLGELATELGDAPKGFAVPAAILFEPEQSMSAFGVGKNMVRAMRYWAQATNLFELVDGDYIRPTDLGSTLLGNDAKGLGIGLDPFFERSASLWAIHWEIATNRTSCTAWDYAFSTFNRTIFTKEALISGLAAEVEENEWGVSRGSVEKDITCLLHMYCPDARTSKGALREEGFESPLADLGLIWRDAASGGYRFEVGPKPDLSPYVLYYAIARFSEGHSSRLLSLDEIFYDHGAPGRVFKLDENAMCSILEKAADMTDGALEWQETGPLRQIKLSDKLAKPIDILRLAYPCAEKVAA